MKPQFYKSLRTSRDTAASRCRTPAFTLIELMVVLVIISILSALTLAGLAGVRQRAKVDKTKSTIRKLHEILIPQYETYASLRVSGTTALEKLQKRRQRIVADLPDQWDDIGVVLPTAAARRYSTIKNSLTAKPVSQYFQGAECLALIVLRGGFDADATENFRPDEIQDADSDGAIEFVDAWGMPIRFVRWAAGFQPSVLQPANANTNPDPMDPMRASGLVTNDPDYGLIPLIYSAGPDGAAYVGLLSDSDQPYGVTGSGEAVQGGWLATPLRTTRLTVGGSSLAGTLGPAAADNLTNHDLMSKR